MADVAGQDPLDPHADAVALHRVAIEAAVAAGAGRILYTSHQGAGADSPFHPARDHAATEQLLADSGLAWTALRNGFYAHSLAWLLGLSLRVQALVHQLQRERGLTNGLLGGEEEFRPPLAVTRKRVDTALRGLRRERAVEDVIQRHLRRLTYIRAAADRGTADQAATLSFSTGAVDALNAVDPVAESATGTDRQLRDGLAALRELAAAKVTCAADRQCRRRDRKPGPH
ncbi:nitrate- and nitrite sensing domain-containing protein [Streptomyces justiciae]|uniref:Nitrate- and nitrite sensing domain-containing protein n=1 Tax=Streptomyces justiciae TaxID=2780140 RepID=A0ABU3M2I7_9ACTN|nr:nitrate- and nitrite sensing domain-containing protein [Streptomyces justiciae]MDT7845618.1 nitrate- and nitrite sensing domain-containing protein [Streptomyces justiciae]